MTGLVLLQAGLDPEGPVDPRGGPPANLIPNPTDLVALEWALALTAPVTVLTLGPAGAEPALRLALARGAARAVRVWDPVLGEADAVLRAGVLAAGARALAPDLVLAGARGLDGASGAVPALLAARLGWPWLDDALAVTRSGSAVAVSRPRPGGRREERLAEPPAVVTVAATSAEPPYVAYRARRAAAQRTIEAWSLADLGLDAAAVAGWGRSQVTAHDWPRPRARRTAAPPTARSAAERLRGLVSGGAPARPGGPKLLEGPAEAIADRLLAWLAERGLA
jgi:electron transfer flavoprotein beta subunit